MVPRSAGGDAQPRSPWVNVALALTLASAFALNWGYLSEHSAASKLPPLQVRRPLHSLRLLLGSRGWRNRDPGYERDPYCRRDDAVFRASPRRTARHRAVDLVCRRRRRRRRPGTAAVRLTPTRPPRRRGRAHESRARGATLWASELEAHHGVELRQEIVGSATRFLLSSP